MLSFFGKVSKIAVIGSVDTIENSSLLRGITSRERIIVVRVRETDLFVSKVVEHAVATFKKIILSRRLCIEQKIAEVFLSR